MVMRLTQASLLLFLLLSQLVWASDFSAHVDRNEVNEEDSFTLVLRYEGQAIRSEPDTQPLLQDFNILAQQRSQQMSYTNGKKESFTNWILTLSPKRTGLLTIPAIQFSKEYSQPIDITVVPLSDEVKKQAEQDFFFETKVTPDSGLVVQGQVLYSEKLYYRYQHNNATLSELKVTDAKVQPLGEVRSYSTDINGVKFGVYERQFAIFPEVSGELVIPGSRFNANIADRYSWQGRPVKATGKPIHLQVQSIPQNYPSNASWLPTSKLEIQEQFSTPLNQWQEGEAVTRTITLKAQGILGNQLPEITLPIVNGIRYYPDQAKTSDAVSQQGIQGISEQAIAMVVTESGEIVLPEIRIPWWNTLTQTLEYAKLPAHRIQVKASKNNANTIHQAPASLPSPALVESDTAQTVTASPNGITWLLGGLLAVSLLLNLLLLWRIRVRATASTTATINNEPELNSHWRAFKQACKQQEAGAVRQHLIAWINAGGFAHIPITRPIASLSVLVGKVSTPALGLAIQELDASLFSPSGNSAFNAQQLLQLVEQEQQQATLAPNSPNLYAS